MGTRLGQPIVIDFPGVLAEWVTALDARGDAKQVSRHWLRVRVPSGSPVAQWVRAALNTCPKTHHSLTDEAAGLKTLPPQLLFDSANKRDACTFSAKPNLYIPELCRVFIAATNRQRPVVVIYAHRCCHSVQAVLDRA